MKIQRRDANDYLHELWSHSYVVGSDVQIPNASSPGRMRTVALLTVGPPYQLAVGHRSAS